MTGNPVLVRIIRLEGFDHEVALPCRMTPGSSGADVRANLEMEVRTSGIPIPSFGRALVPLGFTLEIPEGYEGQIRSRSGLALKHGVCVLNSPGTIDSDYRGPVGVILANMGPDEYTVMHGERIAQLVIVPVASHDFRVAEDITMTSRGAGGFGSTGAI